MDSAQPVPVLLGRAPHGRALSIRPVLWRCLRHPHQPEHRGVSRASGDSARSGGRKGGNSSIEPRYKGDPEVNGTVLTNNKPESLRPDVVLHATRNATEIQCVYEIKFPCFERHRLDPMNSPGVMEQLKSYQHLSRNCRVNLVTPTGVKPYEGR